MEAIPHWVRKACSDLYHVFEAGPLAEDNFSHPSIVRLRRWMLAAGFWRARL
jgi:hypothetical protein